MKRTLAILLALVMALGACSMLACTPQVADQGRNATDAPRTSTAPDAATPNPAAADLKVGVILIGDANEGYTQAHIEGIEAAKKANGLSDSQVIYKYNIKEDESCYQAASDLVSQGCKIIFANSFGHEKHMIRAAQEHKDVLFCHATGQTAAKQEGMSNIFN